MPATAAAPVKAATRLFFVDNIRVFLTILVILHHLMITYSGTGRWYYNEGRDDVITRFVGVCSALFWAQQLDPQDTLYGSGSMSAGCHPDRDAQPGSRQVYQRQDAAAAGAERIP